MSGSGPDDRPDDDPNVTPTDHDQRASRFLAELIAEGVEVDAEAAPIGGDRWAIHGSVAYDGEIIVAEFDAVETAQKAVEPDTEPVAPPE